MSEDNVLKNIIAKMKEMNGVEPNTLRIGWEALDHLKKTLAIEGVEPTLGDLCKLCGVNCIEVFKDNKKVETFIIAEMKGTTASDIQPRKKMRAWNLKEKRMLYSFEDFYVDPDGYTWKPSEKTYDTPNREIDSASELIVQPCTGLQDVAGNLIYEGDWISLPHNEHYWEVIWMLGGAGFALSNDELKTMISIGDEDKMRVVGNIYQNPELRRKRNEEEYQRP